MDEQHPRLVHQPSVVVGSSHPVWYCENGHETCARIDPVECGTCGSKNIHQDEDVLDTWFSSGLWPFSTLGWPEKTPDYDYFYPTSVLETGYDILFFWVARMIMDGLEFTGKPPFHTVYLHGMMRHKDGSKISKSNPQPGDNPLDVIRDYSSDALRYTIITSSAPGNDTKLDLEKVESARNFANKIWNITRFVIGNLTPDQPLDDPASAAPDLSLADRWILSRINRLTGDVTQSYRGWQFGEGSRAIYDFLWSEFADWYIEACKNVLASDDAVSQRRTRSTLVYTLDRALRLLHPTMPFVSEEVWQNLKRAAPGPLQPPALIVADWPTPNKRLVNTRAERDFAAIQEIVRVIRNARAEFNVEPARKIPAIISAGRDAKLLESQKDVIALLARLDVSAVEIAAHADKPPQSLALIAGRAEIFLPLAGMIDVAKEQSRLTNEIAKVSADISRAENLLAGEFSRRAPADVIQKTRTQLEANRERAARLNAQLASVQGREMAPAKPPRPPTQAQSKPKTKKTVKARVAKRPSKARAAKAHSTSGKRRTK
jgi:valyl-tRNA synthetase